MKALRLIMAFGSLMTIASCGNMNGGRDDMEGADSLFSDSVANDSATWDVAEDTSRTSDSLASPSFP